MKSQRGQAMVEFALMFILFLVILLGPWDPVFFAANIAVSRQYAFMAAREAAVYKVDNIHTCQQMAQRVVGSAPDLFLPASWSLTVTPCPADITNWTPPTGQPVTATFTFVQKTVFWNISGGWTRSVSATDYFRR